MSLIPWLHLLPVADAPALPPLGDGVHVLGSDPTCDAVVAREGVSRRHARLTLKDGHIQVVDLASKNGTWVGDRRVDDSPVEPGEVLVLGRTRYRLERREPLAFHLDMPTSPAATRTSAQALGDAVPAWWPQLLADVLAACGDPTAAVRTLREGLGVAAVWHVSWSDAEVLVHAAEGPRPELSEPLLLEARSRARSDPGSVERGHLGPHLAAALSADEQAVRGVLLAGPCPGWSAAPAIAEVLLHALRPPGARPARPPRAGHPFPADLVPCPSAPMKSLYAGVRRYAVGRLPVLVIGETGTGKEHVATLLHAWSDRARGPLVATNCATIPRDLLEAELFGVAAGAATGVSARPGCLREADGGVLFLDEVAELGPSAQAALLRALQERRVQPVGGGPEVEIDVRVVAATNAALDQRVADGSFRADLYYRIAAVTLRVPPLRERPEDIAPLAAHFAARAAAELGRPVRGMALSALRALEARDWPGNVRELAPAVTRMVYEVGPDGVLVAAPAASPVAQPGPIPAPRAAEAPEADLDLERRVGALERLLVAQALRRAGGNRSQAARLLGLSRNGLKARMERYGIDG